MPALPTPTRESFHLFAPHSTTLNDSKHLFDILTLINADINSFSESILPTFYNALLSIYMQESKENSLEEFTGVMLTVANLELYRHSLLLYLQTYLSII